MYKKILNPLVESIIFVLLLVFSANAATPVSKVEVQIANQHIKYVTAQEAYKRLNNSNVIFVDVRTYPEYVRGHIPHAIWAPRGLLDFKALKWFPNKNKIYVVYCATGGRGAISTYDMDRLGYKAFNIKYGFWAWTHGNYPIEKGRPIAVGKGVK